MSGATLSGLSIEQRDVQVVGQDDRPGEFGLLGVRQEPDGAAEQFGWNGGTCPPHRRMRRTPGSTGVPDRTWVGP